MKISKIILLIELSIVLFSSCNIQKIVREVKTDKFNNKEQELEYYYAFTEATKQALFNNYKDAINIYNKCIKNHPEGAAAYFQVSNIYMRVGEIDYAKAYAKQAISIDKKNIWYYLHLASLYQMQRNIDSTILIYEKIVRLDKGNMDYLFNLALLYNESASFRKSLRTVNSVESTTGLNERIIYLKHELYDKLKRKKKAINELRNAIYYFPGNTNFYGLLAEYYAEIGKSILADSVYRDILKTENNNSKVILSYADFLLKTGRHDEAFEYYYKAVNDMKIGINDKVLIVLSLLENDEVLSRDESKISYMSDRLKQEYPEDISVRKLCTDVNLQIGKYKEASEDIKFIVNEHNDNLAAWERLLYTENMLNDYDSVIKYADKIITLFQHEVLPYLYKGLALMQKGENENAINTFLDGLEVTERTEVKAQIDSYLGEIYRKLMNDELSDKYFERALKLNNNDLIVKNNYSYYLAERGDNLERAEQLSKSTIKKEADNSTFLDTYAWIMYKSGAYRKALKYIEKAMENEGKDNEEIVNHYGDILFKLKKYKEAEIIWKSLENSKNFYDLNIEEKIKKARLLEDD